MSDTPITDYCDDHADCLRACSEEFERKYEAIKKTVEEIQWRAKSEDPKTFIEIQQLCTDAL